MTKCLTAVLALTFAVSSHAQVTASNQTEAATLAAEFDADAEAGLKDIPAATEHTKEAGSDLNKALGVAGKAAEAAELKKLAELYKKAAKDEKDDADENGTGEISIDPAMIEMLKSGIPAETQPSMRMMGFPGPPVIPNPSLPAPKEEPNAELKKANRANIRKHANDLKAAGNTAKKKAESVIGLADTLIKQYGEKPVEPRTFFHMSVGTAFNNFEDGDSDTELFDGAEEWVQFSTGYYPKYTPSHLKTPLGKLYSPFRFPDSLNFSATFTRARVEKEKKEGDEAEMMEMAAPTVNTSFGLSDIQEASAIVLTFDPRTLLFESEQFKFYTVYGYSLTIDEESSSDVKDGYFGGLGVHIGTDALAFNLEGMRAQDESLVQDDRWILRGGWFAENPLGGDNEWGVGLGFNYSIAASGDDNDEVGVHVYLQRELMSFFKDTGKALLGDD